MTTQARARDEGSNEATETRGLGGLVAVDGMLFYFSLFPLSFLDFNFFAQVRHHLSLVRATIAIIPVAAVISSYLFSIFDTLHPIYADKEKVARSGPATTRAMHDLSSGARYCPLLQQPT